MIDDCRDVWLLFGRTSAQIKAFNLSSAVWKQSGSQFYYDTVLIDSGLRYKRYRVYRQHRPAGEFYPPNSLYLSQDVYCCLTLSVTWKNVCLSSVKEFHSLEGITVECV